MISGRKVSVRMCEIECIMHVYTFLFSLHKKTFWPKNRKCIKLNPPVSTKAEKSRLMYCNKNNLFELSIHRVPVFTVCKVKLIMDIMRQFPPKTEKLYAYYTKFITLHAFWAIPPAFTRQGTVEK